MDENQPTEPLPPSHAAARPASAPVAPEPFYKRHGLAFAISTLVLGIVVLIGIAGVGTVVAVNVVTHSVSAFSHGLKHDLGFPGKGRPGGGETSAPGQGGSDDGDSGQGGSGAQRELVRGTLATVSDSEWTVTAASGKTVTVEITSSTAFGLPGQAASASDFAAGDEVVVIGAGRTGDTITATRILRLSDFPRPTSTPGPTPGSGRL
jgi:hypothetical protein